VRCNSSPSALPRFGLFFEAREIGLPGKCRKRMIRLNESKQAVILYSMAEARPFGSFQSLKVTIFWEKFHFRIPVAFNSFFSSFSLLHYSIT
jgi:hypothetical protein